MAGVLSPAGADLISRFEGFSATLYDDPAGHCSIGFGHLVHRGPTNGSEAEELEAVLAGLVRRRAAEAAMFPGDILPPEVPPWPVEGVVGPTPGMRRGPLPSPERRTR